EVSREEDPLLGQVSENIARRMSTTVRDQVERTSGALQHHLVGERHVGGYDPVRRRRLDDPLKPTPDPRAVHGGDGGVGAVEPRELLREAPAASYPLRAAPSEDQIPHSPCGDDVASDE